MNSVLIVEDQREVRTLVERWLTAAGYEVRAVADADDAIDAWRAGPSDVVVCDIYLPDRNGTWLAHDLQRRSPDTAVVMMTGYDSVEMVLASVRAGAIDYLVKPLKRERLLSAVERAFEWHRLRRSGVAHHLPIAPADELLFGAA